MFRLLKFIATLCVGAVLGFHLNGMVMGAECRAAQGDLQGTLCIISEVSE